MSARTTIAQAGERRSAQIESLRALAALAVVACHAWGFTNAARFSSYHERVILGAGFLGVAVFFALTGYLIFLPFARRDFGDDRPIAIGGYAINRALRILPLYYFTLIVVAAIDGAAAGQWLRFGLFGQNFSESQVARTLDGPMWSLVVEVHFYVLLPLLAWALARVSRGSARRAAWLLLLLAGASVWVSEARLHPTGVWTYTLPANFVFFVPGMLLALLRARGGDLHRLRGHRLARADLWLAAAVVLWLGLFLDAQLEFRVLPGAAIGSLLVVGAVVLPLRQGPLSRVLDLRALAILGVASYSLYLWHWPVMNWLAHPARHGWTGWLLFLLYAVPVCVLVALVSYRVVEAPPLRLRRRWFSGSPVAGDARAAGASSAGMSSASVPSASAPSSDEGPAIIPAPARARGD